MTRFAVLLRTELKLTMRDFFTVFFALVFPSLMLLLFGSIFGSYPGSAGPRMLDDMTPAYCGMIMGVTGLMSFPLTLASNTERGVYRRFDASPVGSLQVIWSEIAANLLLTFAGIAVLLLFAWLVFGAAPKGSWIGIAGAVLLSTACMFACGFFLIAVAPNIRVALTLCYLVYFLMLFLSGATLPVFLFPGWLKTVSDWLPMTYAVHLMQNAFDGTVEGLGTASAVLMGLTGGCSIIGNLLFRHGRRKGWA